MKTTNKILIIAIVLGFAVSTYFMLKISSFIQLEEVVTSGVYETRDFQINDFDNLIVKNSIRVNFIVSEQNKLSVKADTAFFKHLLIQNKEQKLVLNLDSPLPDSLYAKVTLYSKVPKSIKIDQGAMFITGDTLTNDTLFLDIQRGGDLNVPVKLQHLDCALWEGTNAKLQGSTKSMKVIAQHGSVLEAQELKTEDATISALSGSQLYVFVTGTIDVKASSGGSIQYQGNPKIESMNVEGGGKVSKAE